ncbi:MAG: hypothetical protein P8188_06785 [Gemmatimonadota bacterium]|jgi:hypothetical protein
MRIPTLLGALALAVILLPHSVSGQQSEWSKRVLSDLLPGGEQTEETDQTLFGRIVEGDGEDADGNPIKEYFLESEDGSRIPLPCKVKDKDAGIVGTAKNMLDDSERCGDFVGQRVKLVGDVQSITRGTRRIKRLGKIARITIL